MDMDYKEQYKKYKNKYRQLKREILSADNYPYYKNNYELTKNKFSELVRSFKPEILNYVPNNMRNKDKIEKYDGRYFIIKENWDKNQELNNLTDWFTEECRIKCRFGKYIAPFDYWEMNKINLLKTSQDTNKLRDMLYYKTKL